MKSMKSQIPIITRVGFAAAMPHSHSGTCYNPQPTRRTPFGAAPPSRLPAAGPESVLVAHTHPGVAACSACCPPGLLVDGRTVAEMTRPSQGVAGGPRGARGESLPPGSPAVPGGRAHTCPAHARSPAQQPANAVHLPPDPPLSSAALLIQIKRRRWGFRNWRPPPRHMQGSAVPGRAATTSFCSRRPR